MGFAHRAPRSHGHLTTAFGTSRIDFGGESNSLTFLTADTRAVVAKDPALTRILSQYADLLATESRPAPGWRERFDQALALAVTEGDASLARLAHRMAVTPRTLQRRLADHDTTWQLALDQARSAQATALRAAGTPMSAIAARLGYSDERSLRRAISRWAAEARR